MGLPWQVGCFFALMVAVAGWERIPDTWRADVTEGAAGRTLRFAFWIAAALVYYSLLP
jgi:hypothetical protein